MAKLEDIEGIGRVFAAKLKAAGVRGTGDLLKKGATPAGRKAIAGKAGVSGAQILEWVNHVDLYRIKGIGSEYSDLLEEAGVDTVPELCQRRPDQLFAKMKDLNAKKQLVRQLPSEKAVAGWISQAKKLKQVVTY